MTDKTSPIATDAPAVAGQVQRPVRPVAWADERAAVDLIGCCESEATKRNWERRGSDIDKAHAATLRHPLYTASQLDDALAAERERLCAAIKAADDAASDGNYMLDSDDCIRVIRGTWNPGA